MRIGIDVRLWEETGVGRYARNLVAGLKDLDKTNEYFLFVWEPDENKIRKEFEGPLWHIVPTNIKWHSIREQLSYASFINKFNLDLMHFAYFSLPLLYNRPYVITIHDLIIHHFPTGKASTLPSFLYHIKRLFYLFLTKYTSKKAKAIITVSNATKQEIIDHLGVSKNKIFVTYLGVDKSLSKKSSGEVIESPYILYVGNAYPHKNLNTLIKAFKKAGKDNEKLVLVGKKNYFYQRLQEEFNDKSIVLFGEASDEELSSLYANAKAFVMPSLMEGFGLPPLEAMANGCFVIASDIPALREVCSDSAMFFDPYNEEDLADKIRFVFSNNNKSKIDKFVKKGFKRVESFSWEDMARKTLKVYESSISLRQGQ